MFAARGGFFSNQGIIVTGGTLTIDGSYSIRTFTSSDTLGISGGNLTFDYLVVGRGGDGGEYISGSQNAKGGGGGGQVVVGSTTFTSNNYTVFVSESGGNGNSILNSITAIPGVTVTGNDTGSGDGGASGSGLAGLGSGQVSSAATTGITVTNASAGVSGTNANLPPYYALCYVMKS